MLEHGYIQIYTGDGKGKTTASLGLALRALGHGWKVLIIQVTKGDCGTSYGEIVSSSKFLPNLDVVQFGMDTLLKDEQLVHVTFDLHSSNVISWYDGIFAEIAKKWKLCYNKYKK